MHRCCHYNIHYILWSKFFVQRWGNVYTTLWFDIVVSTSRRRDVKSRFQRWNNIVILTLWYQRYCKSYGSVVRRCVTLLQSRQNVVYLLGSYEKIVSIEISLTLIKITISRRNIFCTLAPAFQSFKRCHQRKYFLEKNIPAIFLTCSFQFLTCETFIFRNENWFRLQASLWKYKKFN